MVDTNKDKVCAVVVTYNRKELLAECLNALCSQTKQLDAIYIVDNFSNDGTPEMLLQNGYINELPPKNLNKPFEIELNLDNGNFISSFDAGVEHVKNINNKKGMTFFYQRMHANTGGAGGFYVGQKSAFELGYDWLWLMDDDGYPDRNALQILLEKTISEKLKASNPLVIDKDNKDMLSFGLPGNLMSVQSAIDESKNDVLLNKANPFNGTLLHSSLVKKVGYIKKEMFIWGDETEYFRRISYYGYKFGTIVNAYFYHPTSKTIFKEKLFGKIRVAKKPEHLEMNYYRNQGYLNRKYGNIFSHKIAIKIFIFFILEAKFKKAFLSLAYYLDGLLNKFKLNNII